ncbi:MAG TPA: hypothetical protein VFU21_05800 [Kofleriaceae bacterium]|nr:hypothetical protein [Kofleriaceae bacterium]
MRAVPLAAAALLLAAADAAADPIVLESYGGPRPEDADRLLAPVMAELGRAGFPTLPEVERRIAGRLSRSAGSLDDARAAEAIRAIEAGYKKFLAGEFAAAVGEIERGLAPLRSAPGAVAGKNDRRDAVMRGLLGLALSQRRLGRQTEATAAMAELIRSFPDREISYKDYGPEPRDFFQKVQGEMAREGKGELAVDVDDDRTVVFVNERYAGVGDVTIKDLHAGRYRVFVQQGDELGRVHEVDVEAGRAAAVSVSWQLDAVLRPGAALVFADESARAAEEARHAVRIARSLGAGSVVVLGIRDNRGRRSVVGAFYPADSTRPLRSGAVAVEPVVPAAERLEALARLLAGDEAAADLVAPLAESPRAAPGQDDRDGDDPGGRPFRRWKWVALGGGLAALGAGVTLIAIHQTPDDGTRDRSSRETRVPGIVTAAAGAALTGLGVYFFVRDARDRRDERSAAIVPLDSGGAAFVFSGSF